MKTKAFIQKLAVLKTVLTSLFFFMGSTGLAGSWSSGGGEILEHAQNPWFISAIDQDKPRSHELPQGIRYCVERSESFSVSQRNLEEIVQHSFSWWTQQFSNANYPKNSLYYNEVVRNLSIEVNTRGILAENCDESVDLRFQFGHLSQSQKDKFAQLNVNLRRYVALTIRTDYSDKLRGKGFIYISPDRGPESFQGHNLTENAWTKEDQTFQRLRGVVIHELGHVFGLKHGADEDSLMSAKFPESIVTKGNFVFWGQYRQAVFFPKKETLNFPICGQEDGYVTARKFFKVPDSDDCIRLYLDLNQIVAFSGNQGQKSAWNLLGRAPFKNHSERYRQLVSVWLPPSQTRFPNLAWPSVLLSAAATEIQQSAVFRHQRSGLTSPLFIQASPRHIQVGGVLDGELLPDLIPIANYRSLSGWNHK